MFARVWVSCVSGFVCAVFCYNLLVHEAYDGMLVALWPFAFIKCMYVSIARPLSDSRASCELCCRAAHASRVQHRVVTGECALSKMLMASMTKSWRHVSPCRFPSCLVVQRKVLYLRQTGRSNCLCLSCTKQSNEPVVAYLYCMWISWYYLYYLV